MSQNRGKWLRLAAFLLCSVLLISLAGCTQPEPEPPPAATFPKPIPEPPPAPEPEPEPERWPGWDVVPAHLQERYDENEDFIGWLSIEGTHIDHPVMQSSTEDPEYYLNRNFYGERDKNGIPFMEARCSADPLDTLSILYGHNMLNTVAFSTLLKYESEAFRDEYPYISFDTMVGPGLYEVVAVFWYDASGSWDNFQPHYDLTLETEERLAAFIDGVNAGTAYEKMVEAELGDQFLLLMTCDRRVIADGRMFVLAIRQ